MFELKTYQLQSEVGAIYLFLWMCFVAKVVTMELFLKKFIYLKNKQILGINFFIYYFIINCISNELNIKNIIYFADFLKVIGGVPP